MSRSETKQNLQVGKADPVPALQVAAIQPSGDRVRLPDLQIYYGCFLIIEELFDQARIRSEKNNSASRA
jgi:hypothetical protein